MRKGFIFFIIGLIGLIFFLTDPFNLFISNKGEHPTPVEAERAEAGSEEPMEVDEVGVIAKGRNEAYELDWSLLQQIRYTEKVTEEYPEPIDYPTVNPTVRELKGKQVEISGFVIPIDYDVYALSKNVNVACFFCGMAGPETVSGMKFKGKTPHLKNDQRITIRGTFRFNEEDPDDWIYHVDDAEIIAGN